MVKKNIMDFTRNNNEISDIVNGFKDGKYIIDESYQRRKVWTEKDKIRLIETILLGLVIPEVFFWISDRNPETGLSTTHIVDGQQRINSIVEFCNDEFKLDDRYLDTEKIKENYGNKLFSDFKEEEREMLWGYRIGVVNIPKYLNKEEIREIFRRLNFTSYTLNQQELRNSADSEFKMTSIMLANNDFWSKDKGIDIFTANDIRRMKDVEFCSTLLILCDIGISSTTQQQINKFYDDYQDEYQNADKNIKTLERIMEKILDLYNDVSKDYNSEESNKIKNFINTKVHLYTLFSIYRNLIEKEINITKELNKKICNFMILYYSDEYRGKNEMLEKYREASQEAVNGVKNRLIRYNELNKYISEEIKK